MTVTSDRMIIRRSEHRAQASGNVLAHARDADLTCSELTYFLDKDSARATGTPRLVQGDNVVKGDLMSFRFHDGDLKRIDVSGGDSHPTLTQKEDVIRGRQIAIQFDSGKLDRIEIEGDSLRQPEMKQKTNQVRGDRMVFRFLKGEVNQVDVSGQTQGTYLTDDSDRVEVKGRESAIRFKDGKAIAIEVADVTDGKLFRHRPAALPAKAEGK